MCGGGQWREHTSAARAPAACSPGRRLLCPQAQSRRSSPAWARQTCPDRYPDAQDAWGEYGYTLWLWVTDDVDPGYSSMNGAYGQCTSISREHNAVIVSFGYDEGEDIGSVPAQWKPLAGLAVVCTAVLYPRATTAFPAATQRCKAQAGVCVPPAGVGGCVWVCVWGGGGGPRGGGPAIFF